MDFYDTFNLGARVSYIRDASINRYEVKGEGMLLSTLKKLYSNLEEAECDSGLLKNVKSWINRLNRTYKKGERINGKDGRELWDSTDKWIDRIRKEFLNRPCIELLRKGALNQTELLKTSAGKPSAFFSEQVWKDLPAIARSDFSDSSKCLLTRASTPAAMVGLRGVESVVRKYYSFEIGQECGKRSLGVVLRELRKSPNVNTKLLSYIDYIRSEKRNLTQHPDKIFTQREAERIFMEIINAVHDIYAEMISP